MREQIPVPLGEEWKRFLRPAKLPAAPGRPLTLPGLGHDQLGDPPIVVVRNSPATEVLHLGSPWPKDRKGLSIHSFLFNGELGGPDCPGH